MKVKYLAISLILFTAMILAACTINVNTDIKKDGSGLWKTEFIFTPSDMDYLSSMGTTADQFCTDTGGDMPAGASVNVEKHGEDTWCVMSIPFKSLEELKTFYTDGSGITINHLEILNGTLYYDLSVDASSSGSDLGVGMFTMNWKVTVPGSVGENNATKVEGNTLTWQLDSTQITEVKAQSSVNGTPQWTWIVVGLCLVCLCGIIIIVIVVVIVLVQRKRSAPAPSGGEPIPPAI